MGMRIAKLQRRNGTIVPLDSGTYLIVYHATTPRLRRVTSGHDTHSHRDDGNEKNEKGEIVIVILYQAQTGFFENVAAVKNVVGTAGIAE
jgi:hypothetical protein